MPVFGRGPERIQAEPGFEFDADDARAVAVDRLEHQLTVFVDAKIGARFDQVLEAVVEQREAGLRELAVEAQAKLQPATAFRLQVRVGQGHVVEGRQVQADVDIGKRRRAIAVHILQIA